MRLTTKIVLGIIAAIFIFSIVWFFFLSLTHGRGGDGDERVVLNNAQVRKMIKLDSGQAGKTILPYNAISLQLDRELTEENIRYGHIITGQLNIKPAINEADKGKLEFSEQLVPFLDYKVEDGSLKISFKIKELYDHFLKGEKTHRSGIFGVDMTLYVDSSITINNKVPGLESFIRDLKMQDLRVDSWTKINIENSVFNTLSITSGFHLKKCKVDTLNVDLDQAAGWTVENCDIEVENLTGGGNHSVYQTKGESRKVNWYPKHREARLNVELKGDTTNIVFP